MDIKKVFRGISAKLAHDFDISAEINHQGNKGTYRESALREFLSEGKMPKKFGIGSGEIIGRTKNASKQSDLVIFDQLNGMSFVYSNDIQIYPIESIFGVIEVKSRLSKAKLIESLENIKSVKSLVPNESCTVKNSFMINTYLRPKPFGIVFAYSLCNNSLESLLENLKEWEKENDRMLWPNLIAVLNEGIIYHYGEGMKNTSIFTNDEILNAISASYLAYQKDTLFHFYSILIDLCSSTHLGSINIESYFDPAEQIGEFIVKRHDKLGVQNEDGVFKLKIEFIRKIVSHCQKAGKIKQRELFIKQIGEIPTGMDEDYLDYEVYHYDPDFLSGFHEVENPIDLSNGNARATCPMLVPAHWLEINGDTYYLSFYYIKNDDIEKIKSKSQSDL